MNLFIYVLLLSIWTDSCFSTNQTNVSSTTGAKRQSTEAKMDSFRKHLLIIIICIIIISFVFTCFCLLRYNCMSEDAPKAGGTTKNQETVANSSKLSLSETKTTSVCSPCSPEKQSLLPNVDKLHGLPRPEKSSIPSSTEKLTKPVSSEKSSLPSSAEKLIGTPSPEKSSIPSSTEKLIKPVSSEKSSLPSSAEKLIRPSSPEKVFRSTNVEKSSRTTNLEKPHKLVSQVSAPYPDKPARPPCVPFPQNENFPPESSSPQKLSKPPRHPNSKRRGNTNRAVMLRRPQLNKTCQCSRERCLVCNISDEPLEGGIVEPKMKIAQNPPFSREVKSRSRSRHKGASMDKEDYDYASDSDLMTCDNVDESDEEITIICNIRYNNILPIGTQDN